MRNIQQLLAELYALQIQIDELDEVQPKTTADQDVLLPALLDKCFRGELA